MNVKDVMTRSPRTCGLGDSANEAARIMWERDCGAVPVVDQDGRVVGIVTDRDLCMAAYFHGAPLSSIPINEVMSREVCTCRVEADLTDAERLMRDHQIRRLPVVGDGGAIVGILSLGDVAQGVHRAGGARHASGDGRELLQTVAVVSEPRARQH